MNTNDHPLLRSGDFNSFQLINFIKETYGEVQLPVNLS